MLTRGGRALIPAISLPSSSSIIFATRLTSPFFGFFAASAEFEALWHQRYEVRGVENQVKHFNHPQLGRFSLQQMYWYSAPRNGSRLLVYLPMDETGERALAWLHIH